MCDTEELMSEPIEYDVGGILEHFADLPDPRSSVNQLHLLVDVIVIAICAVLSGSDGPDNKKGSGLIIDGVSAGG